MRQSKSILTAGLLLLMLLTLSGTTPRAQTLAGAKHEPVASTRASAQPGAGLSKPDPALQGRVLQNYGKLPLSFEANQGQTDSQVKFLSRGSGYTLFLTGDEAVLALEAGVRDRGPGVRGHGRQSALANKHSAGSRQSAKTETRNSKLENRQSSIVNRQSKDSFLAMKLVGANPNAVVTGADQLPGKSNYFIGNDPKKWRTNVPTYAKVKYENVYPGVDLVYYGNQGQLEYDFIVASGADPNVITLDVAPGFSPASGNAALKGGATRARQGRSDPLQIAPNGDLVVKISGGEVRFRKPVIYQPAAANQQPRTSVNGRYRLTHRQVTFEVGSYDKTRLLVIDPALSYSTFLGGTGGAAGYAIAVDGSGDGYATGVAYSSDFPTTPGAFQPSSGGNEDVFVTKFNPNGSALVYSTYLGGSNDDLGYGIALDASGNAYVTGETQSTDFPTTPDAFQTVCHDCNPPNSSAFVTALSSTGSALLYSTYLGGSGNDEGQGLAVDSMGNAYVVGFTSSTDFPVTPGAFQTDFGAGNNHAFVTKLNSSGTSLAYSTYLRGSYSDFARAVAVDAIGDAFVTGSTASTDFPTTPGAFQISCGGACNDAFVTEFNTAGSALVYSTYLGGSSYNAAFGIAVNASENAYVTGETQSTDFPTTPGAFQTTCSLNAFVTEVNASGSALVYSTCLGTGGGGQGIALDASGDAYVTGLIYGTYLPTTAGAFNQNFGGGYSDAFVTEFNPTGSGLVYSTYLGGMQTDQGNGIAVDASGNFYVIGYTISSNFPITPGAFDTACSGCNGSSDAFVTKFAPGDQVWPLSLSFGNQTVGITSAPQTTTLSNSGTNALNITGISVTGANGGDFAQTNTCGTSLAAGASCAISVTFTPSATGTRTAALSVADNAPNSPQAVSLSGTGVSPVVTLSPPSLNFGNQLLGVTSAPQAVTLSTNGPLTISSITTSAQFAQTNNCGSSLGSAGSCTINVTFTPTALGLQNGTLTISDSGASSPQTASLSGTGVQPAVTLAPASLIFPTQVVFTTSKAQPVTLTNTGTGTLTITRITATGPFSQTNTCGSSVAAGANCTISVSFKPKSKGTLTGTVTVADNAPGSPQKVTLSGCGTYIQFSSPSLNFGNQPVHTTSPPKKVTVSNKGGSTVSITSISISGDFAQTNTCGSSLASGASCSVSVTFTPTKQGKRTGDLSISDNGGCSPQEVGLTGDGTP